MPSSLTEVLPFTCRVFSAPTCVGLRYGRKVLSLEAFRGGPGTRDSILPSENLALPLPCPHQARAGGFASPRWATKGHAACPVATLAVPLRVPPSVKRSPCGTGILASCPSPTPFGLGLGPPNPEWIILPQEPLGLRWHGFSPCVSLLIPAFALVRAPAVLPVDLLRCGRRSPTSVPLLLQGGDTPWPR